MGDRCIDDVIINSFLVLHCRKEINSELLWVRKVRDHRGYENVVRTSMTWSAPHHVPLFVLIIFWHHCDLLHTEQMHRNIKDNFTWVKATWVESGDFRQLWATSGNLTHPHRTNKTKYFWQPLRSTIQTLSHARSRIRAQQIDETANCCNPRICKCAFDLNPKSGQKYCWSLGLFLPSARLELKISKRTTRI